MQLATNYRILTTPVLFWFPLLSLYLLVIYQKNENRAKNSVGKDSMPIGLLKERGPFFLPT